MLRRNTLILLVNNAAGALLAFALSALIGRALGGPALGVYATALAWTFPLTVIAEFGLGSLITRDAAGQPALATATIRATQAFRWAWGGAWTLALIAAAPLLSADAEVIQATQLSAPLILVAPQFGAFTAAFRARQHMPPIAWLTVGMLTAQFALTVAVLALTPWGVLGALAVNTLTSVGQAVAAWRWWRRTSSPDPVGTIRRQTPPPGAPALSGRQTPPPDPLPVNGEGGTPPSLSALLRRAWPFAVAGVLAAISLRVGPALLERLSGAGEAGIYAAASRFVEAARLIPNALFGALFPMLAALAGDPPALRRAFRRVMLGLAAFGAAVGALTFPLAAPAIGLTYGPEFAGSVAVLQLAAWALVPSLARAGLTLYAYAVGREAAVNRAMLAVLAFQVALCVWLLPIHGAGGLALVNLTAESAGFILLSIWLYVARRDDPERPADDDGRLRGVSGAPTEHRAQF